MEGSKYPGAGGLPGAAASEVGRTGNEGGIPLWCCCCSGVKLPCRVVCHEECRGGPQGLSPQ